MSSRPRVFMDHTPIDWQRLVQLPWWVIIGGAVGALFVIGALIGAPKIGIATFFSFVVLGQLIGTAVINQIGGFGVVVASVT